MVGSVGVPGVRQLKSRAPFLDVLCSVAIQFGTVSQILVMLLVKALASIVDEKPEEKKIQSSIRKTE